MSRPRAQLALTLVTAILGLLVVLQIHSQSAGNDLASQSTEELTVLVANLNTRNGDLRAQVADLEQEATTLQTAHDRGESSLGELEDDLQRFRIWAGLDAAFGAGVRVTIHGPIDGESVMDLVNELRNAGAEAIAIDGTRVLASTVVAGPAGGISVGNVPLGDPFSIDAIGSPETLVGTLTRLGGIRDQLAAAYPETTVDPLPLSALSLPATTKDLRPAYSTPRL